MENLKEKIQEDLKKAIKGGKETERLVLRGVLASLQLKEKEKRYSFSKENLSEEELSEKASLADQETIEIISSEMKKRRESIEGYKKGNREDLAKQEEIEMEILKSYLPEQLSDEELEKIIKEAVESAGAETLKDMGKVMAEVMPKVKGKAEGQRVSSAVKEILS